MTFKPGKWYWVKSGPGGRFARRRKCLAVGDTVIVMRGLLFNRAVDILHVIKETRPVWKFWAKEP